MNIHQTCTYFNVELLHTWSTCLAFLFTWFTLCLRTSETSALASAPVVQYAPVDYTCVSVDVSALRLNCKCLSQVTLCVCMYLQRRCRMDACDVTWKWALINLMHWVDDDVREKKEANTVQCTLTSVAVSRLTVLVHLFTRVVFRCHWSLFRQIQRKCIVSS